MTAGRSVVSSPVVQELLDDETADMHSASVHLDAAAINTLFSVPTQIVAAPGAGRGIFVIDGAFESVPGVGNWLSPSQLGVFWGSPSNTTAAATVANVPTMLGGGAPPIVGEMTSLLNDPPQIPETADIENAPLVVAEATTNPIPAGAVTAVTIGAQGSGYAPGDTGLLDSQQGGAQAAYVVNTVDGGGGITALTITDGGGDYSVGTEISTSPTSGGGDGQVQVTIAAITPPTGDLYVTVFYRVIDLH